MKPATRTLAFVGVVLPCSLLAFAAARPPQQPVAPTAGPPPGTLQIVISTELNGNITPCGCSKPMLGGLPRRASFLKSLGPVGSQIAVDNGDLTESMGRQDELKAETIVEAFNTMRYAAINLGEKDFRLGMPYLQSLRARFKGGLLCANARKADGSPHFQETTSVDREVAGRKVKVTVVGVLSEQFKAQITAINPEVQIEDPTTTLERLKPELVSASEVRILLYHGSRSEAEALADRLGCFQLVVCGHEGDHPLELKRNGATAIACSGQDGKYIGRASLDPASRWEVTEARFPPLVPEFTDDPGILAVKASYLERVAAEDLLGKVPKLPTTNGDRFAGNASCLPCHAAAAEVWRKSGHAHAIATLAKVQEDRDPECVRCHVVGLDHVSGFASRMKTPQLENVGCESCHGPAAKHAANPSLKPPKAGAASCSPCHVPQHSPKFDFPMFWEKIKH